MLKYLLWYISIVCLLQKVTWYIFTLLVYIYLYLSILVYWYSKTYWVFFPNFYLPMDNKQIKWTKIILILLYIKYSIIHSKNLLWFHRAKSHYSIKWFNLMMTFCNKPMIYIIYTNQYTILLTDDEKIIINLYSTNILKIKISWRFMLIRFFLQIFIYYLNRLNKLV